ncbi:hypothetical protein I302_106777 [Kwoniella bestiolae CBS 10118]|uniref:Uncharacterized protein n=1 Tax=Kwoniella bestiolae CBS 10118 TaxID=1296100 RepID=A0AAJ8KCB8_9TREE
MFEYNEKTLLLATEVDQLSLASEYTADHLLAIRDEAKEEETVRIPSKIRECIMVQVIQANLTSLVSYTRPPEFDQEGRKYIWSVWWYARGILHYKRTRKDHRRGGWKWVKTERGKVLDSEYIWPNGRKD